MSSIIFFTKYTAAGASSRYRVYQYLHYFQLAGFTTQVKPLFTDIYLINKYNNRKIKKSYIIFRYLNRIKDVLFLSSENSIYIEYELLPYFPAWLEKWLNFKRRNYVVDYDDAIFHNYDLHANKWVRKILKSKISTVIAKANKVITGSEYLTKFANKYNSDVIEIPTSIDFNKYQVISQPIKEEFIIGWIGTPSNSQNVINIIEGLKKFLLLHPSRLILIGFDKKYHDYFDDLPIDVQDWNSKTEVQSIKSFSVGIMPLLDTPFNRGKCGFKLIQYMASGIPTISTPLPANINIDKHKENLFATTDEDWYLSLKRVYDNRAYFCNLVAANNIQIVQDHYSIEANHNKFIQVFKG